MIIIVQISQSFTRAEADQDASSWCLACCDSVSDLLSWKYLNPIDEVERSSILSLTNNLHGVCALISESVIFIMGTISLMLTEARMSCSLLQRFNLFLQFFFSLLFNLFSLIFLLLLILLLDLLEPLLSYFFAKPVDLPKNGFQLISLIFHKIDYDRFLLPACLGLPWIYEPDWCIINYCCVEIGR